MRGPRQLQVSPTLLWALLAPLTCSVAAWALEASHTISLPEAPSACLSLSQSLSLSFFVLLTQFPSRLYLQGFLSLLFYKLSLPLRKHFKVCLKNNTVTDFTGFFPLFLRTGREKARLNFLCEMMCGVSEQNKGQAVDLEEPVPRSAGIKPQTVRPKGCLPPLPPAALPGDRFSGHVLGESWDGHRTFHPIPQLRPIHSGPRHRARGAPPAPVQPPLHLSPQWAGSRTSQAASLGLSVFICKARVMRWPLGV